MSVQISAMQSVTITIESNVFKEMLDRDICNTRWTLVNKEGPKSEGFMIFNSDYTITGIPVFHTWENAKWEYVRPNQIIIHGQDYDHIVVFFNERSFVMLKDRENEFIGTHG